MRIFISSPYSHPDPIIRDTRARIAGDAAAWLWCMGHIAYSPIAHWHGIALRNDLPGDAASWEALNRHELSISDAIVFLEIEGWASSVGMAMERDWAGDMAKAWVEVNDGSFRFRWHELPSGTE